MCEIPSNLSLLSRRKEDKEDLVPSLYISRRLHEVPLNYK